MIAAPHNQLLSSADDCRPPKSARSKSRDTRCAAQNQHRQDINATETMGLRNSLTHQRFAPNDRRRHYHCSARFEFCADANGARHTPTTTFGLCLIANDGREKRNRMMKLEMPDVPDDEDQNEDARPHHQRGSPGLFRARAFGAAPGFGIVGRGARGVVLRRNKTKASTT